MEDFLKVCKNMKSKLGRELQTKEKEFLCWVSVNYQEELQSADNINQTTPIDLRKEFTEGDC